MKKYIFIVFVSTFLLAACGSMRIADVGNLSEGMSINEVNSIMGSPIRVLSSDYRPDGKVEVLEYRSYQNDAYAIEFWNGRLTGYDFMYEDRPVNVVTPSPVYPVSPPPRPRPQPDYVAPPRPKPTQPSPPSTGRKPTPPPNQTRPTIPANPPQTRPTTPDSRPQTRPTTPATRPTDAGKSGTVRPTTGSGRSSSSSRQNEQDKKTENATDKDK